MISQISWRILPQLYLLGNYWKFSQHYWFIVWEFLFWRDHLIRLHINYGQISDVLFQYWNLCRLFMIFLFDPSQNQILFSKTSLCCSPEIASFLKIWGLGKLVCLYMTICILCWSVWWIITVIRELLDRGLVECWSWLCTFAVLHDRNFVFILMRSWNYWKVQVQVRIPIFYLPCTFSPVFWIIDLSFWCKLLLYWVNHIQH